MPDQASTPLPAAVRQFLEEHRYGVVATLNVDGSPQQAVVWYLLDGDTIVINSADGRRWPANLRRDGRLSLAIEDGLDWVGINATVEIIDDQARAQADIAAMARRYDDPESAERAIRTRFERQHRVSFRLRPTAIHAELTGD